MEMDLSIDYCYQYFQVQGAIMVASLFQIFVGFSGLMGLMMRFVGPLTVAPTIALIGLALFGAAGDFSGLFDLFHKLLISFKLVLK